MELKNKNIVLCITGGIAAYKAVNLASFLKKRGANVYPVLTKNALNFITPVTLKTITGNKVTYKMFDESDFIPHISLSDLADIVIVAPATANIIAKAATGIADDMVSTLLLSTKALKIIVPAMNTNMYENPITQVNIQILKDNGFKILEPDKGLLACGVEGIGKFPDVEKIYGFIRRNYFKKESLFESKKVLITLGGTIEDIDPVRYISNRSSGRMGFAFAEEFILRGAKVKIIAANASDTLINNFKKKYSDIEIVYVRSAAELSVNLKALENDFDLLLMASAVSDYTVLYNEQKIKKEDDEFAIKLVKTEDILKNILKRNNAVYIGFAAESENILANANNKLINKNLDFLIANEVTGAKAAIGGENAEVYLLNKWNDEVEKFDFTKKREIALSVLNSIEAIIKKNTHK